MIEKLHRQLPKVNFKVFYEYYRSTWIEKKPQSKNKNILIYLFLTNKKIKIYLFLTNATIESVCLKMMF